jgi:probable poly-beta-1,6-N-acetyl-D-glucosamine export protein
MPNDKDLFISERITQLRGIATVGVVAIHTTGVIISNNVSLLTLPELSILTLINQLSRFTVPLFLFLSAFLYAHRYRTREILYRRYLLKRIHVILIPYLCWSVFYLAMQLLTGEMQISWLSPGAILVALITGQVHGHLYFIPLIFQFYILMPLFICSYRLAGEKMPALSWTLVLLSLALISAKFYLSFFSIPSAYLSNCLLIWWLPFVVLGTHAGLQKEKLTVILTRWRCVLATALLFLLAYMVFEYVHATHTVLAGSSLRPLGDWATFLRPSAYIYAILFLAFALLFVDYIHNPKFSFLLNSMNAVGHLSFGIYLVHPAVMAVLNKASKLIGYYPYNNFQCNLALLPGVLIVSFIFVKVSARHPMSRYIWGIQEHQRNSQTLPDKAAISSV